jgi:hypothetical protein
VNPPLVRAFRVLLVSSSVVLAAPAAGHQFGALQVDLGAPRNGSMEVTVTVDSEHLPPGLVPPATPAAERGSEAIRRLVSGLVFEAEGEELPVEDSAASATLPSASQPISTMTSPSGGTLLSRRFSLAVPEGVSAVRVSQRLPVGQFVVRAFEIEGVDGPLHWAEGAGAPVDIALLAAGAPPPRGRVFLQYLGLGFTHILPKGLDHICFVLGLFLLSTRWRSLLVQVTAFTAAHTLTLAASIYGIVRLPPEIVEPMIALSIAYVAIENLVTSELKPWRPALVFAFGLLHGLGFAGVLTDLGLPRERFLTALLSFNAGVELGQLAVIAGAFLLVGFPFAGRPWFRRRIVVPASLAIAGVGLYWFVQRALL